MLSSALALSGSAASYLQVAPLQSRVTPLARSDVRMGAEDTWKAAGAGVAAALALASGVQSASAGPFTRSEIASLTYDQIKGTGLANTCPKVEGASSGSIKLAGGKKCKHPPCRIRMPCGAREAQGACEAARPFLEESASVPKCQLANWCLAGCIARSPLLFAAHI